MIRRVIDGYRFLSDLSERERMLAEDGVQRNTGGAKSLIAALIEAVSQ
jgi:hypothetical protein